MGSVWRNFGPRSSTRGGQALPVPCDISKSSDVKEMVDQVLKTFGRIDVLVNNAGIIRRGTIETMTEEDWDRVIAINLKGTFNCCKAVVATMKRQGGGNIVNVSSISGKMGDITSAPGYGPSKAGGDALMKTLARQLAPYGIRANAVAPHAIETEMSAQWSEERRRGSSPPFPLAASGSPRMWPRPFSSSHRGRTHSSRGRSSTSMAARSWIDRERNPYPRPAPFLALNTLETEGQIFSLIAVSGKEPLENKLYIW